MKKSILACLTGFALVATVWLASPSNSNAQAGHGNPVIGTWLGEVQIDGVPGLVLQQVTSVGIDGTFTSVDSSDFGLGGTTPGFDGPIHGTWFRESTGTYVYKGISQSFDEAGIHSANVVTTALLVAGSAPDTVDGTWSNEIFLPSQDPFQDVPVGVVTGTSHSRRMPMD